MIDPAPSVARQTARVLAERGLLNPGPEEGSPRFITSGKPAVFEDALASLLGMRAKAEGARCQDGELSLTPNN